MNNSFLHFAVQHYSFTIMATSLFLYFIYANKSFSPSILKYFYWAIYSDILLTISDMCHSYFAMLNHPTWQRMFFAACSYSLRIFVILSVLLLFSRAKSRQYKRIITIPALINVIAAFSAFVTPKSFYYTPQNEIVRGPIISVPFIVSALYFVLLVFSATEKAYRKRYQENIIVIMIFAIATAATLLEAKLDYYGLLPALAAIGCMVYYMYFMSDKYYFDPLTDAEIRARLYERYRGVARRFSIIMFDMNDLKKINDSKGHAEGDKALRTISKSVLDSIPSEAGFFRIGGDEFVVVFPADTEEEAEASAQIVREAISKTPYTAAVGYTLRDVDEPIDKALTRADRAMYEDKAICKSKMNE